MAPDTSRQSGSASARTVVSTCITSASARSMFGEPQHKKIVAHTAG